MRGPWTPVRDTEPGDRALSECVQASRLLGGDPHLVLHGGGNSSAKVGDTIHVKASGYDMGSIGPEGFAPLDRRALDRLLDRPVLTDGEMVDGLRAALLDPSSSNPSIETLLHNLLPQESVLHTHADAIVTLTNTRGGGELLEMLLGSDVMLLPYCMPGFDLARLVQREWTARGHAAVRGIVLAHHGLFTFAESAQVAYEEHVELVGLAETLIRDRTGIAFEDDPDEQRVTEADDSALHAFAGHVREVCGSPVSLWALRSPDIQRFLDRPDLDRITQQGPSTLEHVIRTRRTPLLGRDVEAYEREYRAYFERNRGRSVERLTMLEPTPRVILDPELGLVTAGRTEAQARAAEDIYRHTIRIVTAAEALGGYVSISEGQAFDIEYWELEQAKLR